MVPTRWHRCLQFCGSENNRVAGSSLFFFLRSVVIYSEWLRSQGEKPGNEFALTSESQKSTIIFTVLKKFHTWSVECEECFIVLFRFFFVRRVFSIDFVQGRSARSKPPKFINHANQGCQKTKRFDDNGSPLLCTSRVVSVCWCRPCRG